MTNGEMLIKEFVDYSLVADNLGRTSKSVLNFQNELKCLLDNPVLIYGAGKRAIWFILCLKALNADIIGLTVSDLSDERTLGFEGYKVQSPETYETYKDTAVVLIATSEKYQGDIKANCLRLGFNNIILSTVDMLEAISLIAYKKLFLKHNLPLDSEIISIKGGKYLNPFSDLFSKSFALCISLEEICSTVSDDMSMAYEGPYECGQVEISKDDVVFDLGASVGYVSVYAASKGAEPYAFEPDPENHPLIKKHSELNGNRIHLVPYVVADKCETADFRIKPGYYAGSSLDANAGGEPTKIPQITIDEFVKREGIKKVDYIHANIMGAERLMLQGAQETIRRFTPKIVVCTYEFHDDKQVLTDLIIKACPDYKIEYMCHKLYAHV